MPTTLRMVVLIGTIVATTGCHRATPEAKLPHDVAPQSATPGDTAAAQIASEEVSIAVGDRRVPGTIARPAHGDDLPAVLLHAGSGPTDRDWNNPLIPGTNGSGKLLAEALARAARAAKLDTTLFIAPEANHVREHEPRPLSKINPMIANYNAADRVLDPATVDAISRWILAHAH